MRTIKIIVCILFAASLGIGAGYYMYIQQNTDHTYPVFTSEKETLEVPVNATEKDLLQGLSAYDEKDGDLTSHIMVSDISKFIEKGVSDVEYVVFDRDSHATKLTRKVTYKDYESPEFSLTQELKFPVGKKITILSYINAKDEIDGNLTNKIRLLSSDLSTSSAGIYDVSLQVTNSHGDTSMITLKVEMERETGTEAPEIDLKQYIVYCDKGEEIHPKEYLKTVKDADGKDIKTDQVKVKSDVDKDKAGVYYITYSVKDKNRETESTAKLAVVIRD